MPLDFNDWLYLILLSVVAAGQIIMALALIFVSGYLVMLRLEIDHKSNSKTRMFSSIRRRLQL